MGRDVANECAFFPSVEDENVGLLQIRIALVTKDEAMIIAEHLQKHVQDAVTKAVGGKPDSVVDVLQQTFGRA